MYSTTLLGSFFSLLPLVLAEPTSRHIWQWPPNQEPRVKFYDVPYEFDDYSVKHADLIGSYYGYTNGEVSGHA